MTSRSPKQNKSSSASGVVLYGLHFIFDSFGATRPIRLGVAVALSLALDAPLRSLAMKLGVAIPGGFILENSLFGLSFLVFFLPLLFRSVLPEPIAEQLFVVETFAKKIGASRSERRQMHVGFYGLIISKNGHLPPLDLSKLKEERKEKIDSGG
jgi:hypothetical protein